MGFNGRENSPPICRITRYAQEINIQGSPNMNPAKLVRNLFPNMHTLYEMLRNTQTQ